MLDNLQTLSVAPNHYPVAAIRCGEYARDCYQMARGYVALGNASDACMAQRLAERWALAQRRFLWLSLGADACDVLLSRHFT